MHTANSTIFKEKLGLSKECSVLIELHSFIFEYKNYIQYLHSHTLFPSPISELKDYTLCLSVLFASVFSTNYDNKRRKSRIPFEFIIQ